ncbi:MAG: hypothetical protein PHG16_08410 [Lachnospiraceae bacterium]|nr:hypothetical protein [Lachnospiraceae bacterium]
MNHIGAVDVIAVILVVEGVLNLFGVMFPYSMSMTGKYTPESMQKWIRPSGVSAIILGIGCELLDLGFWSADAANYPGWFAPLGLGLAVVGIVASLVLNKIFLKKIK